MRLGKRHFGHLVHLWSWPQNTYSILIFDFENIIRPVDLVHAGNPEAEVNEGDVEGDGGGDEGAHVGVLHLQKVVEGQN